MANLVREEWESLCHPHKTQLQRPFHPQERRENSLHPIQPRPWSHTQPFQLLGFLSPPRLSSQFRYKKILMHRTPDLLKQNMCITSSPHFLTVRGDSWQVSSSADMYELGCRVLRHSPSAGRSVGVTALTEYVPVTWQRKGATGSALLPIS